MDSNHQEKSQQSQDSSNGTRTSSWIVVAVLASVLTAAIAVAYGFHQEGVVGQLSSRNQELAAGINDVHSQLDTLTAKLNDVSSQAASATAALQQQSAAQQSGGKSVSTKQRVADSHKLKQLQTALNDQQKQLKDAQDQIAKNRNDLEGTLSSTKDELNGSIARTHEELVALEQRGERSFFEFDIAKSKSFQREVPLSLSLRKADTKHKSYDMAMIVEDNQLMKRKVNLYEPVWIHRSDDPQPVQIVVNKIDKDRIHGYVSAPKYRTSQLTPVVKNVSEAQTSLSSSQTPARPNPD
jgi:uncharacterized phage infection (PIP) family protein YhgE